MLLAEGFGQHQKAQTSAKRVGHFLAEIIDMTGEFVEMSKQIREQIAEMDRLRAELDNYRPEHRRLAHACNCGSPVTRNCQFFA